MFEKYGLRVPEILLPDEKYDYSKWAVIACDQFTSQPEYWDKVRSRVIGVPSTLHITYPEAWLDQGDRRIETINANMIGYEREVLTRALKGTVLERIPPRVKIRQNAALETPHIRL